MRQHRILMLFLARRAASLRPAITGRAWRALSSSPFDEDFLLPKGGDGPAPARAERRPSNRYGEGRRDRSRGGVPAEGSWTKRNEGRAFERTRLFVSALDPGTRWQELKDHFRDGGFDVIYASVSTDRYTGESKGCGIVQLATEAEAERAIGAMDRSELDGATIFCREDRQNRDRRTGDNSGTRRDEPRGGRREPRRAEPPKRGAFDARGGLLPWADRAGAAIAPEVLALLGDRDDARAAKEYATADAIRDSLFENYGTKIDDRNREVWAESFGDDALANLGDVAGFVDAALGGQSPEDEVEALLADARAARGDDESLSFDDAGADAGSTEGVADVDVEALVSKHADALKAALAADRGDAPADAPAAAPAEAADPAAGVERLVRDELQALKVPELKDRLRAKGLKVSGAKAELIERLLE